MNSFIRTADLVLHSVTSEWNRERERKYQQLAEGLLSSLVIETLHHSRKIVSFEHKLEWPSSLLHQESGLLHGTYLQKSLSPFFVFLVVIETAFVGKLRKHGFTIIDAIIIIFQGKNFKVSESVFVFAMHVLSGLN